MANPLTGNFDAVVQIAMRQINGMLATLHQNAALDNPPLKLMHSASVRLGDVHEPRPDLGDLSDWVLEVQRARPGRAVRDLSAQLSVTSPPGVAKLLTDALADLGKGPVLEIPPNVIRGLARIQVSTLTLSTPPGSTSEVTVHANVRAHYYPDAGTTSLPAPIHGHVEVVFEIHIVPPAEPEILMAAAPGHLGDALLGSSGKLIVRPSSDDSKIRFVAAPGSGLSGVEESRISAEMRKVVRHGIELLPVDLPKGFPFQAFKGVGSGSQQALALPIRFPGTALPANGFQGLTESLTGSSGFAFAVRKEHVISLIDLEKIRSEINSRTFRKFGATYRLNCTVGPTLTFHPGHIEVSGRVDARAAWRPDGFVSFKQRLTLHLRVSNQTISLRRLGAPEVDESWFISHDFAVDTVRSEMVNAVAANQDQVRSVFDGAKAELVQGLKEFDLSASATFTEVEITPDGILVRGNIGGGGRNAPVIDIADTHQGTAFTAFKSWIPGGRITRFIWSWVESGSSPIETALGGVEKSFAEEHSFIFPKPPGITDLSRICLRLEGTQTLPDGSVVPLAGGTTCEVSGPAFELDLPPWWAPLALPIRTPDMADDVVMRDAVAGHVAVQAAGTGREEPGAAAIVYFPDWRATRPLDALGAALTHARLAAPLDVVVVLPAGAFDQRKGEIDARLAGERFPARVHFTEDDESGWSRTFGVAKTPSVFLINARREFVWKHEGDPPPAVLAAALYKHMPPGPAARLRRLRLTVKPGQRAPEVRFQDDRGNGGALHRLRGRHVLLNFWQSWSAPCLKELRRLQGVHEAGKGSPVIIAFHGGTDDRVLSEIRKQVGTSFAFVQDSEQRVARMYGVRCWPTTIAVSPAGDVEHIQQGVAHEHARAAGC